MIEAPELQGRLYAEAHSDAVDRWFREVFTEALGTGPGLALAAVGGYGRRELSPYSDIDVILVHDDRDDYAEAAEALWYPVWDRGMKMGYAVVNPEQAELLAREELHWATAFLSTRLIAGDHRLLTGIDDATARVWADPDHDLLDQLADAVHARHQRFGDAAFQIEPHLKEGRGGLRDVHAMMWASRAVDDPGFVVGRHLTADADTLLAARVALHRVTGGAGDVLTLDVQDEVANALGDRDADQLMARLATAARRIGWYSDDAWFQWEKRVGRIRPMMNMDVPVPTEFGLVNGYLELSETAEVEDDPLVFLRLAVSAARNGRIIGRDSLRRLRDHGPSMPEPWPEEARTLFADLLLAGRNAISVIEDLDQFELMTRLLPEWETVRCKPQRNVMHTFTVDRHLCETASNASALVDRVVRPDLLVVGALFHDIGKGYPGDHTIVGMDLIRDIAARMGYPDNEVGVLVDLCRHHLLLPDVATRRDLSDPGTIRAVAAAVDSKEFLHLLASLTEADSIATGPATWGSWREGLLNELVQRTSFVLEGGAPEEGAPSIFPTDEVRALMAEGDRVFLGEGTTFTVIAPDRPRLFSQMAGILTVHGLDVLDAQAYSDPQGMASNQFILLPPASGEIDWDSVKRMASAAIDGRVALTARVRERARNYERFERRLSAVPPRRDVVIDNEISDLATVIEVHAADRVGVLFWITQALAELRLDIRSAKVQTFGPQAVDSFYVCDASGRKLSDPEFIGELELAIRQAVGEETR
ncbi:MAG: [protein-PII] uridylyltransferase [Actinomycetota bacterium]